MKSLFLVLVVLVFISVHLILAQNETSSSGNTTSSSSSSGDGNTTTQITSTTISTLSPTTSVTVSSSTTAAPPPPTTSSSTSSTEVSTTSSTTTITQTTDQSTSSTTSTTTTTTPPPTTTTIAGTSPAAYRVDKLNVPVPSSESEITARGVITFFALIMTLCGGPTILLETQMALANFQFSRCANQSFDEAVLNLEKPLAFPDNMLPFVSVGHAQNGYFRGAIVSNIIIVPICAAVATALYGFFKVTKDMQQKAHAKARKQNFGGDDDELRNMLKGDDNDNNNNSSNGLEKSLLSQESSFSSEQGKSSQNQNITHQPPKSNNNNTNLPEGSNKKKKPNSFYQTLLEWMYHGGTQSVVVILVALGAEGAIASVAGIGASPLESPTFGGDGTLIVIFLFLFAVIMFAAIKFIAGNAPERFLSTESFVDRVPLSKPSFKPGKDWIPKLNENRARFIFMGTHCWRPTSLQVQRFMTTVPILFKYFHGPRQEDRRVALAALMGVDLTKMPPPPAALAMAKRMPNALPSKLPPPKQKSLAEKMREQERLAKGEITQEDLDKAKEDEAQKLKEYEEKLKQEEENRVQEMQKKLEEEKAKEGGMLQVRYRAYLWTCFFFVLLAFSCFIGLMRGLARVAVTPEGCQGAAGGATAFFAVTAILVGVVRPFHVPLRNITMCVVFCWCTLTSLVAAAGGDGFAVEGLTVFTALLPLFAFLVTCLPRCILANLYLITAMPINMKPIVDRMNQKYDDENPPTPEPEKVEEDEKQEQDEDKEKEDKKDEEEEKKEEQEQNNKADSDLDDENVPPPLPHEQPEQPEQQQQNAAGADPDLEPVQLSRTEEGESATMAQQSSSVHDQKQNPTSSTTVVSIEEVEGSTSEQQQQPPKTKEEQEDDDYITDQLRKLTVAPPTPNEEYLKMNDTENNNQEQKSGVQNFEDDDEEEDLEGELLSLEEQYSLMGVQPDEIEILTGKKQKSSGKKLNVNDLMESAAATGSAPSNNQFATSSSVSVDPDNSQQQKKKLKKKKKRKATAGEKEDLDFDDAHQQQNETPRKASRRVHFSDEDENEDDLLPPPQQRNTVSDEQIRQMLLSGDIPNAREQYLVKGMMLPDQEERLRKQAYDASMNDFARRTGSNNRNQHPSLSSSYISQLPTNPTPSEQSVLTPTARKMMKQFNQRQADKQKEREQEDERTRMKFYDEAHGNNNNPVDDDYSHQTSPRSTRATGGGYRYGDGRRNNFHQNDDDDNYRSRLEKQRQVDGLLDDVVNHALSSPRGKDAAKKSLLLPVASSSSPTNTRGRNFNQQQQQRNPSSTIGSMFGPPRNQIHPSQAPLYHVNNSSMAHEVDDLLDEDDLEEMERLMREAVL